MTVVIDASVALKWVLLEPGSEAAADLHSSGDLTAPNIWLAEAGNTLWRYVIKKEFDRSEAQARMLILRNAPVDAVDNDVPAALDLSCRLGHPLYDCLYLALALSRDIHLVTADRRFFNICEKDGNLKARVRLLEGV